MGEHRLDEPESLLRSLPPEPPAAAPVETDPVEAAMLQQLQARAGRHPGQIIPSEEL